MFCASLCCLTNIVRLHGMRECPVSFINVLDQLKLPLYFRGRAIMARVLSEKAIKNHSAFTAILDKI